MNAEIPKRRSLGRGLDALFGDPDESVTPETTAHSVENRGVTMVPVDLLSPSDLQPRRHFDETALADLAASIADKGVLQPLLVRALSGGRFEIIAGERRWRAAQRARHHEVPVLVRQFSDAEALEVALVENLQRQDLSPVEEARGYQRLQDDFGHTQERVAEIIGKSRAHVANTLRLLNLPEGVLALMDQGQISPGQARPLIGLPAAETLARLIIKKGLTARQAERLAKGFGRRVARRQLKDADTAALERSLAQATGYEVNIRFDGKGGSVTVGYTSLEQLDDIVRRLSAGAKSEKGGRDPNTVDLEELLEQEDGMSSAAEPAPSADPASPV